MKKLTLLMFMAVTACTTAQSTGISAVSCPPDSTYTYQTFGQAFMQDNCLSCHSKDRPLLTTQAQIQANANRILDNAVYTDAMPQNGNMAIEDRQALGEWLACGAP